jgi:hypothetical protein
MILKIFDPGENSTLFGSSFAIYLESDELSKLGHPFLAFAHTRCRLPTGSDPP